MSLNLKELDNPFLQVREYNIAESNIELEIVPDVPKTAFNLYSLAMIVCAFGISCRVIVATLNSSSSSAGRESILTRKSFI